MKQTILLERVGKQTRMAVLENSRLCEIYIDRPDVHSLSGNIYLGRVQNIVKGIGSAFVDIGEEKNAFLPMNDLPNGMKLSPGREVLVQVDKEPGGTKGCRVAGRLNIPGRMIVLLPHEKNIAVSKKIGDETERERLHKIAKKIAEQDTFGMIVRTAAEGADEAELREDYVRAKKLYEEIMRSAAHRKAPALIHSEDSLPMRLARDHLQDTVDEIITDGEGLNAEVSKAVALFAPEKQTIVREYEGTLTAFDAYGVDRALDKALIGFFWLDSGASLVFNETEALTVIDVNTAKFTGKSIPEETLFKTNCEAAREIARLLRLKDIGGIVIIDFIDMTEETHREALLNELREALSNDRNHTQVYGFTHLGLVEMSRKKTRKPLSKQLLHVCSDCSGHGTVESFETIAWRIERELWRRARSTPGQTYVVETIAPITALLKQIGTPEGITVVYKNTNAQKPNEYRIGICE